jgi:hypothetical protein
LRGGFAAANEKYGNIYNNLTAILQTRLHAAPIRRDTWFFDRRGKAGASDINRFNRSTTYRPVILTAQRSIRRSSCLSKADRCSAT